jgi:hypothetical protein
MWPIRLWGVLFSLEQVRRKDFLQDWPASGDFRQCFVGDVTEDNTERDRFYDRMLHVYFSG